jgi:hypothetical protein
MPEKRTGTFSLFYPRALSTRLSLIFDNEIANRFPIFPCDFPVKMIFRLIIADGISRNIRLSYEHHFYSLLFTSVIIYVEVKPWINVDYM